MNTHNSNGALVAAGGLAVLVMLPLRLSSVIYHSDVPAPVMDNRVASPVAGNAMPVVVLPSVPSDSPEGNLATLNGMSLEDQRTFIKKMTNPQLHDLLIVAAPEIDTYPLVAEAHARGMSTIQTDGNSSEQVEQDTAPPDSGAAAPPFDGGTPNHTVVDPRTGDGHCYSCHHPTPRDDPARLPLPPLITPKLSGQRRKYVRMFGQRRKAALLRGGCAGRGIRTRTGNRSRILAEDRSRPVA